MGELTYELSRVKWPANGEAAVVTRIWHLWHLPEATCQQIRAGQVEAGRAWMCCRDLHAQARTSHQPWPKREDLRKAARGGKFRLHSQALQWIVEMFVDAIELTRFNRQTNRKHRYPHKDKPFYPLAWPAQAVCIAGDRIILPMGRGNKSIVLPKPEGFPATGSAVKLIWNRDHYELHGNIEVPTEKKATGDERATIDLGQIHQAAVTTSSGKGLIVSGRGIRSVKRDMNKMHGEISRKQKRCKKGSRRWWKLQHARNKRAGRCERQVRDLRHKGTRQVIDFCKLHEVGILYIGNPDGVRRKNCGRHHNQRMSQWQYGEDLKYLRQKAFREGISSFSGTERGTSSHCPECGHRMRPKGRWWKCTACGFQGHRDLVGSANMHPIAFDEKTRFPSLTDVTYLRPGQSWEVSRRKRLRSGRSSRPGTGHGEG